MAGQVWELNKNHGWQVTALMLAVLSYSPVNAGDPNSEGKAFADSMNQSVLGGMAESVNTADIPGYQGIDIPEKDYYGAGLGIEDAAESKAQTDPTAQFIKDAQTTRPTVTIDRNTDPLFKRYDDISFLSHSLTDTYSGCVSLPVGNEDVTIFDEKTCNINGIYYNEYPQCKREYSGTCTNGATYHEPYNLDVEVKLGSKGRSWFTAEVDLANGQWKAVSPSDGIKKVVFLKKVDWEYACKQNNTQITYLGVSHWSGSVSHVGGGQHDNSVRYRMLQAPSCGNGLIAKMQIEDTKKSSDTSWVLGGSFKFRFRFEAKCDADIKETFTCDVGGGYTPSQFHSKSCVYSGIKKVNGFDIYKDCWEWQEVYVEEKIRFEEEPYCQTLRNAGCGFVSSSCKSTSAKGHCLTEEIKYSCPREEAARHVSLCGNTLLCSGGDCADEYQAQHDASDDFKKAATSLAVAKEIAEQMDVDNLSIFKGDDMKCKKVKTLGFSNCCRDDGWGVDIGLAECSEEEETLGLAKEADRTHYIGSYESGGFLDKREYQVYCTYPSKLARILVQQGKPQLGESFGSPKAPNCTGFTATELEILDFNTMDLSEFYSDVEAQAANGSVPNANAVADELSKKMEQMTGGN